MTQTTTRWLFGDQLGPHFLDAPDQRVVIIESRAVFRRKAFHRAKAHLVLSAMRHRAVELGDRCQYVVADTYAEGLAQVDGPLSVCGPTSHAADEFVRSMDRVTVAEPRGFASDRDQFRRWADGRGQKRLLMEDFYRDARRRLDVLMDGDEPVGGRWNLDADNREPPPASGVLDVAEPWWPAEDEIDQQVRADLDAMEQDGMKFVGRDGPRRFAATRDEALHVLRGFLEGRLAQFGPYEDAMLSGDPWMAHSLLSAPLNLGLLDPMEVVHRVEKAHAAGDVPLQSAEGFIRQLIGWRDYVWHLYWYLPRDYRSRNHLAARRKLPAWFAELDADAVEAACLKDVLAGVRDHGWVHHIPRLMVLGSYALQRGWSPAEVLDWFHRCFVDGYDWVMLANVIGMSQFADGGVMATKPYTSGGAYVNRMSDYCGGCRYSPKIRVGEKACPFTAGYWWFLSRNSERLQGNFRLAQPLKGLQRLADLDAVIDQEDRRGSTAP
ncbi:cryptochrome/photolyase family protein [Nakamurella sp. A5-74]|uniref:Cryptochrome/photolyase family protein n=1 Tax=Nakamurella sp. A5-74 TaxID=3158264 RepID=A0AAU8DL75_9ACTN